MADRVMEDFPSMEYACYFPDLESLLRDSTSRFLAAVSAAPNPDLNNFRPIIFRVLKAYLDPPLEAVWFFSAVTFRDTPDDVRSILRLLSAFTANSPAASKPLALHAPVVFELCHSAKPRREIEALVEDVLRYISICSSSRPAGGEVNADAGRLLPVFGELVKVWNVRNSMGRCPFGPFQVLFPLVGNETRHELTKEGCSVAFLAGVVVAEAFLLSLCLKVQGAAGVPRSELHNELRIWAVSSILAYQNQQFFGVLLNMLANPPLPVYSLLDSEYLYNEETHNTKERVVHRTNSNTHPVPAVSSTLLGVGGFAPPGQMAGVFLSSILFSLQSNRDYTSPINRGLSYLVEAREENSTRTIIFQKDGVTMPFLLLMYPRGALVGMELYIIFAMCKQSVGDEILVRDVLYDALILVDYSSLSGAEVDQADSSLFPIFVSRLVITIDAINDARRKGDQGRDMLYINAFLTSNIPSYLIGWVIRQAGTGQLGKLIAITPQAFLEWLVDLEDKGLKVFGENCSRIKERLMQDESKNDNQRRISQSDADFFFIDKQSHQEGMDTKGGEDEEVVETETADNAFMAAAQSIKVMANGIIRKTKDCGTEDATVVKFVKYKAEDSSVKD